MTHIQSTRRPIALAAILLLAAGCRPGDIDVTDSDGGALPPPAAAFYAQSGGIGLADRLESLESDLAAVLQRGLDDEAQAHMLNAEATTDRLLEDEPDYAWLGSGYYVEARLRQIQALADRIVSEMRRGVARELVLEDVAALRLSVADLREQLANADNGAAPPPLDSLLAGYDASETAERVRAATGAASASADTTSETEDETTTPTVEAAPADGGPLGRAVQP